MRAALDEAQGELAAERGHLVAGRSEVAVASRRADEATAARDAALADADAVAAELTQARRDAIEVSNRGLRKLNGIDCKFTYGTIRIARHAWLDV